jgi:NADH-quinone oxidoreductase subunit J
MGEFFLINILCLVLIFFAVRIDRSRNAVAAALYLIGAFFVSAVLVMLQEVEFFAPLFVIIYVGAIAVLFLFVIMVLRTKEAFKTDVSVGSRLIEPLFLGVLLFLFRPKSFISINSITDNSAEIESVNTNLEYLLNPNAYSEYFRNILEEFDNIDNLTSFAQVLFNYNSPIFLLAGIILLIALMGAIMLTHTFDRVKAKENDHLLSRSDKFLSLFKNYK